MTSFKLLNFILSDKRGLFGVSVLLLFVLIGICAPYITAYEPFATAGAPALPLSWEHPLGTDLLGRDVFSQLVWGSRTSILVAISAALGTAGIGIIIGLTAALSRPIVDEILMRFTDVMLFIPRLPLLILFAIMLGRGFFNMVIILILIMWPWVARLVRSEALSIKQRPFVDAARVVGVGTPGIARMILPHILPLILATTVILVMQSVIWEASLSFLGLGDPSMMSWGNMFYYSFMTGAIYTRTYAPIVMPGLCIMLLGIGIQYLSYVLQEITNPKLKEMRKWKPF